MHYRGSMTKKEIQQIIKQGWDKRRARLKKRSKANSEAAKKWKAQEDERRMLQEVQQANLKRFRHYLGQQINSEDLAKIIEEKTKK